jgi:hypothetical protein
VKGVTLAGHPGGVLAAAALIMVVSLTIETYTYGVLLFGSSKNL